MRREDHDIGHAAAGQGVSPAVAVLSLEQGSAGDGTTPKRLMLSEEVLALLDPVDQASLAAVNP